MKTIFYCHELISVGFTPESGAFISGRFGNHLSTSDVEKPLWKYKVVYFTNCLFHLKYKQWLRYGYNDSDFLAYHIKDDIVLYFNQNTLFKDLYNNLEGIESVIDSICSHYILTIANNQSDSFNDFTRRD